MHKGRLVSIIALFLGILATIGYLFVTSGTVQTARAASIIVVDTGLDDLTDNGNCTLREAIQAANTDSPVDECAAGSGVDEIVLGLDNYQLTLAGWGEDNNISGDLDVTESITLTGLGPDSSQVDASDLDRILDIQYGVETVVISGVTFKRGNLLAEGGGIKNWGADLTLINVKIFDNNSNNIAGYGGGLYHTNGNLTMLNSSMISNSAYMYGGGLYAYGGQVLISNTSIIQNHTHNTGGQLGGGGAYLYDSQVSLNGGEISNNMTGYDGGGVYLRGSTTLTQTGDTLFAENFADYDGGGIFLNDSGFLNLGPAQILSNTAGHGGGIFVNNGFGVLSATIMVNNYANTQGGATEIGFGEVFMRRVLLENNSSASKGGGIINWSQLTMDQSTLSTNQSPNGGGIYNGGVMTLTNSTISGNRAVNPGADGGAIYNNGTAVLTYTTIVSNSASRDGGGLFLLGGTLQMHDSIIAYNSPENCGGLSPNSQGYNLEDGDTCSLGTTGDITSTNPVLKPLIEESGVYIHPLSGSSPAIDAGMCIPGLPYDQRSISRPLGLGCDIGAYEAWRYMINLPAVFKVAP